MTNATRSYSEVLATLALNRDRLESASGKVCEDMRNVLGQGSKGFDHVQAYTETVHAKIAEWGIDTAQIFTADRNPKVIKRFVQFVHAVNAGDFPKIDVTTAVIIYALHLSGGHPLNTDALQYIAAGLADGRISPETRGVSKRTVNRLCGRVGLRTIPTQYSRSVGKNGFLQLAGATVGEPGKVNQKVTLNSAHPMVQAFFTLMNKATDAQIDSIGKKGE